MDRRDARLALDLARQWAREGLLPPASLAALERRHAPDVRDDPDRESFGSGVLYGLGGILLGAAAFALLVLMQDNGIVQSFETAGPWVLLGWGIVCMTGAFAIDLVARKPALADSFHVAALVAVTASAFPRAEDWLWLCLVALAFAAGVLAYRRARFMVPFLALVAFNVAVAAVLFGYLGAHSDEDLALTVWFPYAALQVGLLVAASKLAKWPWPTFSLAAATLLLAGTFLGFYFDVVENQWSGFDGDVEVLLAALMAVVLVAGLALREKGMVLAAALVIAIDSIVFAFDVGEIVGGLVAILAVAALLIWQAGALRRYLRE